MMAVLVMEKDMDQRAIDDLAGHYLEDFSYPAWDLFQQELIRRGLSPVEAMNILYGVRRGG